MTEDVQMPRSGSGTICPPPGEGAGSSLGAGCCGQRSCCRSPRGLRAARMVHDLSASCKGGRGFSEPQLLGFITVGPFPYPALHFFAVLCFPQGGQDVFCGAALIRDDTSCLWLSHMSGRFPYLGFPSACSEAARFV